MKLFLIACAVLLAHTGLLWWVQLSRQDQSNATLPLHAHIIAPRSAPIVTTPSVPAPNTAPAQARTTERKTKSAMQENIKAPAILPMVTPAPVAAVDSPTDRDPATDASIRTASPSNETGLSLAAPPANRTPPTTQHSVSQQRQPSSNADYLHNPPPVYPAISARLNEQGKVVVRVLIGATGEALDGAIVQSSGYHRLDQSAFNAVMHWRYLPGIVNGQAQDMWFDVPIQFKPPN